MNCVFDLKHNREALVIALIFGATPELLLSLLKLRGEQYQKQLQDTEASPGTAAS